MFTERNNISLSCKFNVIQIILKVTAQQLIADCTGFVSGKFEVTGTAITGNIHKGLIS
jgi:hypothetical protein